MRRRQFITLLGSSAVSATLAATPAGAQNPGRVYRLGNLFSAPHDAPHQIALLDELSRSGFVEGKNLILDRHGYGLRAEEFDEHAAELVKTHVDVILAGGDAAVRAAQRATAEIPILALTDDMIGQGFARSLVKPGGNITGCTILASELDGKRQEILIEAVPAVQRIAALVDSNTTPLSHVTALADAARPQGIELSIHRVAQPEDIAPAIDAAKAAGAAALNVLASSLLFNNRIIIFDRAVALRLPAIYQWPEMADQGGLIGYGPRIVQLYRDVQSRQLIKLLGGTQPADIPVEQPTKFELVINLKTARSIGLDLPAMLVARADQVIEQ